MKITCFLNKENNNLDLIRILLACIVILGHTIALNGITPYWTDPVSLFFPVTYSGALAVKLFFFISGLVVTNSHLKNDSFVYFAISRLFRILPALLFLLLITVFLIGPTITNISISEYFSDYNNYKYIIKNIYFKTQYILTGVFNNNLYKDAVNGSLWSLNYEIKCYIALMCTFLLIKNKRTFFFNISFAALFMVSVFPSNFILSRLSNNPEIYYLPISFAYGVFLAINQNKSIMNLPLVLLSFFVYFLFRGHQAEELFLIVAFCNLIIFISSREFILKFKPKYDISYGIYLWGFLIQQIVYFCFGTIYAGLHFIAAVSISITIAYISFIYIEKPSILIGKQILAFYNSKNIKKIKFKSSVF
ncbi:acyltransferase family protein [Flavobacterium gelatinilyticum]|uniref:acyltransferase family protein n=1 Tax=Flavobacterium gelatinilyticum TaxID=3003260 RepID=UPI0024804DD8|nr:acyltransferase [Flavobacterium gelatinilyticum]